MEGWKDGSAERGLAECVLAKLETCRPRWGRLIGRLELGLM